MEYKAFASKNMTEFSVLTVHVFFSLRFYPSLDKSFLSHFLYPLTSSQTFMGDDPLSNNTNARTEVAAALEERRLSRKRQRAAQRVKKRAETSVYVTGIPTDATLDEVTECFSKYGILLPDSETGKGRIKLYVDESGNRKGDALVTYALAPSVANAVDLLDGTPLRYGGPPMSVQPASFEHKDASATAAAVERALEHSKRPRRAAASRALIQEALSWAEEGQTSVTSNSARMVILKNVFDPASADYALVREDIQEGCAEFGDVEKINVFEGNPEGVVAIRFATVSMAKKCISVMDGRWYDRRQLSASFFDGHTDYRVKRTDEEKLKQRDKEWEAWLQDDRNEDDAKIVEKDKRKES